VKSIVDLRGRALLRLYRRHIKSKRDRNVLAPVKRTRIIPRISRLRPSLWNPGGSSNRSEPECKIIEPKWTVKDSESTYGLDGRFRNIPGDPEPIAPAKRRLYVLYSLQFWKVSRAVSLLFADWRSAACSSIAKRGQGSGGRLTAFGCQQPAVNG